MPMGLKITDQDGNTPDIDAIQQEWSQSRLTREPGPTTIFIENISTHKPIVEQVGLLMPYRFYIGNKELL
jgi:hypothetical protein